MSKQITREQRYEIYAYKQAELSNPEIAERLGVDRSTIYREYKRNCDKRSGKYKPDLANRKRDKRMNGRNHAMKMDDVMKARIDKYLDLEWSP